MNVVAHVDCLIEDQRWNAFPFERMAQTAVAATLTFCNLDPAAFEVCIMACDDTRIAALNTAFRSKDAATNVLSWPTEERAAACDGAHPLPPHQDPMGPTALGDIAIAFETCASEAQSASKDLRDHATHLVVHATLHLLGYDHERDADGDLMEACESEILGKLGLTDPYSDEL